MSGEYFCIEEVVDPTNYYDEFRKKSSKSLEDGVHHFYRDNDASSNHSKKSQDYRLHEIEEQLELAENRCNTLKGKLDCMKQIYHSSSKVEPPIGRNFEPSLHSKGNAKGDNHASKKNRKRSSSSKRDTIGNRHHSPSKKRSTYNAFNSSTTDTVPHKSSNSSTDTTQNISSLHQDSFQMPIKRQNSTCIGTDNTGAAVRTINNILSGITASFNRLSRGGSRRRRRSPDRPLSGEACAVYEVPRQTFSPRLEKRMQEQQKKLEELAKTKDARIERVDRDVEHWTSQKLSKTSVKSKSQVSGAWDRHGHNKKHALKCKTRSSSGSINIKKPIKSIAKHVENTTKMRPVRTAMLDEDTSGLSKKRKKAIKRLRPISKVSLCRKPSENCSTTTFEQFTTDKLVELYHNVAAKESDSDDSNHGTKNPAGRQKAGGDLPIPAVHIKTPFEMENKEINRQMNALVQSARTLSPIEEHRNMDGLEPAGFFSSRSKNYAQPTISSTLKQATKCYLHSFNFRCIPFCAAKSTSPSHNIGINIQQVMSIIKTRQPITGISPTLAHNISLAAGKLQSHPLHAFVSSLSSRIGNGRSMCPLTRSPINYNHLQELAKEIPEIPEEDPCLVSGDAQTEPIENVEPCVNGPSGDTESPPLPTVWTLTPENEQRCNCAPPKGVPLQQVLSKYQVSEGNYKHKKNSNQRPTTSDHRGAPTFTTVRKPRSGTWVRRDSKITNPTVTNPTVTNPTVPKPSQTKDLQGREKNLKTVLNNLHDEFDSLNTKYEQLAKTVGKIEGETPPESIKELEVMEAALNKKEEEINMVMSLYTEVMALKDQVKKLRERTSQGSIAVVATRSKTPEPVAAMHLTQLLKQIQNYQDRCKSRK